MPTEKQSPGIGNGQPGPGRRKGVPNGTTLEIRQAFIAAFEDLGGVPALVAWGREKPDLFYPALLRLAPREIAVSGELTVPHTLVIHDTPATGGQSSGRQPGAVNLPAGGQAGFAAAHAIENGGR